MFRRREEGFSVGYTPVASLRIPSRVMKMVFLRLFCSQIYDNSILYRAMGFFPVVLPRLVLRENLSTEKSMLTLKLILALKNVRITQRRRCWKCLTKRSGRGVKQLGARSFKCMARSLPQRTS